MESSQHLKIRRLCITGRTLILGGIDMARFKRWKVILVIIGAASIFMFGCEKVMKEYAKKVHLTFASCETMPAQVAVTKEVIKAFEKKHPNIKVELQLAKEEKILVQIAGGAGPDIFLWHDIKLAPLAEKGILLDISSFMNKEDFDSSKFFSAAIRSCSYNNRLYGLPVFVNTHVIFYNQDLFDEEGVRYPTPDWTWDDFLKAAIKLTKDIDGDGRTDQFGGVEYQELEAMFDSFGATYNECRVNSFPDWVKATQFLIDLRRKYKVFPSAGDTSSSTGLGGVKAFVAFANQRAAMFVAGVHLIPEISKRCNNFRWDIAVAPKVKGKDRRAIIRGVQMICILRTTKHPQEAWEFAKFYCGAKAWERRGMSKIGIPALKEVATSDSFLNYPKGLRSIVESIKDAKSIHFHPKCAEFMGKIFYPEMGKAFLGLQTAEETVKNIDRKAKKLLREH